MELVMLIMEIGGKMMGQVLVCNQYSVLVQIGIIIIIIINNLHLHTYRYSSEAATV